jgi:Transposase DDE domain
MQGGAAAPLTIEEVFGWIKSSAGLAKVKLRGRERVDAVFTLALAAYNLIRLPKLLAVQL